MSGLDWQILLRMRYLLFYCLTCNARLPLWAAIVWFLSFSSWNVLVRIAVSKSKLGTCVCLEDVLIALTDSCAEAIPFVLLPFVTTCYGLSAVVGCIWQIPPFFFFFLPSNVWTKPAMSKSYLGFLAYVLKMSLLRWQIPAQERLPFFLAFYCFPYALVRLRA